MLQIKLSLSILLIFFFTSCATKKIEVATDIKKEEIVQVQTIKEEILTQKVSEAVIEVKTEVLFSREDELLEVFQMTLMHHSVHLKLFMKKYYKQTIVQ